MDLSTLRGFAFRHGLDEAGLSELVELFEGARADAGGAPSWVPVSLAEQLQAAEATLTMSDRERPADEPRIRPLHLPGTPELPERYLPRGRLGRGGAGEVWQVFDQSLQRHVAMKVLRPELSGHAQVRRRFLREVLTTAQLQHPGVVPIYEGGELPDGRLFFTMKVVEGETLGLALRRAHTEGPLVLRRLVSILQSVCEAVAYAHQRGVLHRDLKPGNVMIGAFGEVVVLDWGISRVEPEVGGVGVGGSDARGRLTVQGSMPGTPPFMPPEQLRGEVDRVGPHTDVYALGVVLYELITGRLPLEGTPEELVALLEADQRPRLRGRAPDELAEIYDLATRPEPGERFQSAAELAQALGDWLEGVRRRGRAQELVAATQTARERAEGASRQARGLRAEVAEAWTRVAPNRPVADKEPIWALEDRAAELERAAATASVRYVQGLRAALAIAPDLPEARAALAAHYRRLHEEAERAHDATEAARLELELREHDRGLDHHAAYLEGLGRYSLRVAHPGASAELLRFEEQGRRLVPVPVASLTTLPVEGLELPAGSYLARVSAPGRRSQAVPFELSRGGEWTNTPPGESAPREVHLAPADGSGPDALGPDALGPDALGPDDCLVPAGWCWVGGDPLARNSLDRQRVWVDDFVIRRFPVTNREYIAFLDDLVDRGREEEALEHVPKERARPGQPERPAIYGRTATGHFELVPDLEGDLWDPDWPVLMVPWVSAMAYCRWLSEETGLAWRLPYELEREKAARGVDGRSFPWGEHPEPTWFCNRQGIQGRATPARVQDWPLDVSVYGVRGLAGNTRDWCLDLEATGPMVDEHGRMERVPVDDSDAEDLWRVNRGGAWSGGAEYGRAALRLFANQRYRGVLTGIRLVRSWSPGQGQ